MIRMLFLAGAMVVAVPIAAQTLPATDPAAPIAQNDAGRPQGPTGVAAANRAAMAGTAQSGAAVAAEQARYATDLANYRAAVQANRRTVARDAAVEARQERAYAMAMADWRAQVQACDRGKRRACKAPAPNPASYW